MEPFTGEMKRTHYCGAITTEDVGKTVTLCGWVHRRRDHGGLIFVDLRDREGFVQVVFNPQVNREAHEKAEKLRSEFVISVRGRVERRPEGTENPSIPTGEVEILAEKLSILNESKPVPFPLEDETDVAENVRLKYRYLDLRRPSMQRVMITRHQVTRATRDYFYENGFLEIETPFLTKSTPEGARDYLVPSRVNPGAFYALPQSPQLFKQILMVSGYDRYFQIVRCFRDEDLRADRQPEFTQIDVEMSFVDREDIFETMEGLMEKIFRDVLGVSVNRPFRRMPYRQAMDLYGSDKPDLRFGMEITDITEEVKGSDFNVFNRVIESGGVVRALVAPQMAGISRSKIDELTEVASIGGAKGLAYFKVEEGGLSSPIAKFFGENHLKAIQEKTGAEAGDMIFIVADTWEVVCDSLGRLRLHLGRELNLIDEGRYEFLWVIDFPLLEYDEEEKRFVAMHHPFTSPVPDDIPLLDEDPLRVRAQAYDLVLNGSEVGGGSIRIHQRALQEKMFSLLNISEEEARVKFGFLLDALQYGAPPHGGIAFGLDRLVMIIAGVDSIRDVIPFPKTQKAVCLMSGAPSPVGKEQLKELHIKLDL
ncbi:MAG: aspartate--tRNA ligase [Deltaproteobacteria bacterium]|nr:MAG: aspartate--tRNA ligase [Deltaproteobacteria bacterium]